MTYVTRGQLWFLLVFQRRSPITYDIRVFEIFLLMLRSNWVFSIYEHLVKLI